MILKTIYFHGLESKSGGPKVDWLKKGGFDVLAPNMNYQDPSMFTRASEMVTNHTPHFLIGSSMGGWFAWNLGKIFKIPVLLFNPAILAPTLIDINFDKVPIFLILGKNDDVIDPEKTYRFLEKLEGENFKKENVMWEEHGHRTPELVFQKGVNFFIKTTNLNHLR